MDCQRCCAADDDMVYENRNPELGISESDVQQIATMAGEEEMTAGNLAVVTEAPKTEPVAVSLPPKTVDSSQKKWQVSLTKVPENRNVGLEVDYSSGDTLKVKTIKDGLVRKFNEANPENAVQEGDIITEINGRAGDNMAMMDLVKSSDNLNIVFNRGQLSKKTWQVKLRKSAANRNVGLDVNYGDANTLKVKKVKDGLVFTWNQENPDNEVKEGDYITEINGKCGDNMEMFDIVKKDDSLKILFNRDFV
mmetsp:Transcript_29415/g.51569  ORF Transcript_29415/g.51569 Transcript_29415/m.51569 type:complete len:250 (-) Transcript_29415:61-810(-)